MLNPAAAECPPNFINKSLLSFKQSNMLKPVILLHEALITPSFDFVIITTGRLYFSCILLAATPITPSLKSSPKINKIRELFNR